jgi:molybdopterin molybdotransferase
MPILPHCPTAHLPIRPPAPTAVTPHEAALRIVADIRRQPALRVPLDDALDAVLAESVTSPLDIPAHTNSAMDGYAVRSTDVRGATAAAPARLRVAERIPAGQLPTRALEPGACARIFTGAAVPEGADSVVRQEDTDLGDPIVSILSDRDAGANVRQAGEDIRRGSRVFEAGTELGPAQLGVLASLAVSHPMIYRRPRVAIIATGDEIVDIDQPDEILSGRKAGSSNTHTLIAMVRRAGGEPVSLGIAADSAERVRELFRRAMDCDLILTTGGVSVGEHDHVRPVVTELGGELKFWRISMRPGAPVGFGLLGEIPWIGLPGNPVSTMVTFELFVRAAIRIQSGRTLPFRRTVSVTAGETIHAAPRLQHFLRAVVSSQGGQLTALLTGPQGSGILSSMARANALLVVPEGRQETPAGARVQAILLDDPGHVAEPEW